MGGQGQETFKMAANGVQNWFKFKKTNCGLGGLCTFFGTAAQAGKVAQRFELSLSTMLLYVLCYPLCIGLIRERLAFSSCSKYHSWSLRIISPLPCLRILPVQRKDSQIKSKIILLISFCTVITGIYLHQVVNLHLVHLHQVWASCSFSLYGNQYFIQMGNSSTMNLVSLLTTCSPQKKSWKVAGQGIELGVHPKVSKNQKGKPDKCQDAGWPFHVAF